MTQLVHDENNNVLHIMKAPKEHQELRGFIVQVADNEEDAQNIANGDTGSLKIMPVLTNSNESALKTVKEQGKVAISIVSYEQLKFQCDLLQNLAKQNSIKLVLNNEEIKVEFRD